MTAVLTYNDVCSAKKYTKRSSNTLRCLVYFSAEQTLLEPERWIKSKTMIVKTGGSLPFGPTGAANSL